MKLSGILFFVLFFVFYSNLYSQWWVQGGQLRWPYGNVNISQGDLILDNGNLSTPTINDKAAFPFFGVVKYHIQNDNTNWELNEGHLVNWPLADSIVVVDSATLYVYLATAIGTNLRPSTASKIQWDTYGDRIVYVLTQYSSSNKRITFTFYDSANAKVDGNSMQITEMWVFAYDESDYRQVFD